MKAFLPVVMMLTIGIFLISNIVSDTAEAISGNCGAFLVRSNSKLEIGSETTILGNTATVGGGVYVESGGTFTMSGGTIGSNDSFQTDNGIYNIGTMNINDGVIFDNIYSSKSFNLNATVKIYGSMVLENSAIITVQNFTENTQNYDIKVKNDRQVGTIMVLQESSTKPYITKFSISGFDTQNYGVGIVKGDSETEWKVEIFQCEIPTTWQTEVASSTYMTTTISPSTLTSIIFESSIPNGYSKIGTLSTGLEVFKQSSDETKIAFVCQGRIVTPQNSSALFKSLTKLETITFTNFSTINTFEASNMFRACTLLKSLDLSSFDTKNFQYTSAMFYKCSALTNLNVSSFNMTKVLRSASMFEGYSSLSALDITSFNKNGSTTENIVAISFMFKNCTALSTLDMSTFKTNSATDSQQMFMGCASLKFLNLTNFNTSNVTNMTSMFDGCTLLEEIVGLSSFNKNGSTTKNVAYFQYMFKNCSSLKNLDLTGFNTSGAIEIFQMFYGCSSLATLKTPFNVFLTVSLGKTMYNGSEVTSSLPENSVTLTKTPNSTFASVVDIYEKTNILETEQIFIVGDERKKFDFGIADSNDKKVV